MLQAQPKPIPSGRVLQLTGHGSSPSSSSVSVKWSRLLLWLVSWQKKLFCWDGKIQQSSFLQLAEGYFSSIEIVTQVKTPMMNTHFCSLVFWITSEGTIFCQFISIDASNYLVCCTDYLEKAHALESWNPWHLNNIERLKINSSIVAIW